MHPFIPHLGIFLLVLIPAALSQDPPWTTYDVSGLDFGPDYTVDEVYPPINDTIQNLRGTRLYGFADCGSNEKQIINEAWDDFYTLSQQKALYDSLDWNAQAAKEFWGAVSGNNAMSDDAKTEIQRMSANMLSHSLILLTGLDNRNL